jgi:5-deoxy-glucuronate isomerase
MSRSDPPLSTKWPNLHYRAGSLSEGESEVLITPEGVGLSFVGLRTVRLEPRTTLTLNTGEDEVVVLPLAGGCHVETDGLSTILDGRDHVFARISDFAYLPRDSEVRITAELGCELALPSARAQRRLEPAYGQAEAVGIEILGAGQATRQKNNYLAPDGFPADRLCICEVLTPDGNWSSYPPHKHDDPSTNESVLEEIYYYRLGGGAAAYGCHRTYDLEQGWDITVTVRSGDVFLVPRGYHGPCMAAPGYPMWYLNVLAGPAAERSLIVADDPDQHWIRESWQTQATDPRIPMTTATAG